MLLGRSRATRRHGRSVELLQLQERARGQRGHLGSAGSNGTHLSFTTHPRTLRNLKPQFPKLYNFSEGAWSPARSPRDPATPNGLIGLTVTLFRSAATRCRGRIAERPARSPYADPAVLERAVITRQDTTGHRLERAPVFTRQDTTGTAIQRTSSLTPANALTRSSALTRHTLTSRLYSWSELARV